MRTKRTNGSTTYEYVYSGDKLAQMTITDHTTNPETERQGTVLCLNSKP